MSTVVIPAWWLDPAWLPQGSSEPQDSAGSRQRLGELSSGHAVRPRAPAVPSRETKGQVIKCHGYELGLSEDWNGQCDQAVRAGGGGRARQAGAGPVGQARPWVLLRVQRRPLGAAGRPRRALVCIFSTSLLSLDAEWSRGGKIGTGNSTRKLEGPSR